MRTLIALLVVLALAFVVVGLANGWIHFSKTTDTTTIEIETDEIKEAAGQAKEEGRQFLRKAGEALEEAGDRIEDSVDDSDAMIRPNG